MSLRSLVSRVNRGVDTSCSAAVSATVVGVNLFYLAQAPGTIAVPFFTACCCTTAAAAKVLKRVINQSRPAGARKLNPGMPSNHATALSFLTVLAAYGLLADGEPGGATLGPASVVGYSLYATALRVSCGHHTVPQVVVGYLFGAGSAMLCLAANYMGYDGERRGGRIDELSETVKCALLGACVITGVLAFHSILKGSPLVEKWRAGKAKAAVGPPRTAATAW
ncbi:dolichyldiphosphatase [Strigomonas culicis]|uniref:Dolichyldiphosphatase n=1 Tax=Strigomonas culicis TaxID=28005 RepID=S9WI72_9TRYP|nr:dolichyldiphosphatase [Strigomonas culicis]EPY35580.1 dolichyldiphosphatase [Strigomonas culicis]|eukprot:EPY26160.1 dolichyldiphosphatase [Strigomonas culicis]